VSIQVKDFDFAVPNRLALKSLREREVYGARYCTRDASSWTAAKTFGMACLLAELRIEAGILPPGSV
jgi:hypothetical protein